MTMSTDGERGDDIDLNDADLNDGDLNNDGVIDADEQLVLSEEEEALPWLEAEEEDDEELGPDIGRIIGWCLLGLLAIAALFSAVWWLNRDAPDPSLAADGSTIEASDDPYKTRPDDAGGREVDGTGDTSFSVAEGENVVGSVGNGANGNGSGSSSSSSSSSATSGNSGAASGEASASEGVGVQIGAFSTRASAQSGWSQLSGQYAALKGQKHRILEGQADSGTIYRLQAVAANSGAADGMCRAIRSAGGDCQVKR